MKSYVVHAYRQGEIIPAETRVVQAERLSDALDKAFPRGHIPESYVHLYAAKLCRSCGFTQKPEWTGIDCPTCGGEIILPVYLDGRRQHVPAIVVRGTVEELGRIAGSLMTGAKFTDQPNARRVSIAREILNYLHREGLA